MGQTGILEATTATIDLEARGWQGANGSRHPLQPPYQLYKQKEQPGWCHQHHLSNPQARGKGMAGGKRLETPPNASTPTSLCKSQSQLSSARYGLNYPTECLTTNASVVLQSTNLQMHASIFYPWSSSPACRYPTNTLDSSRRFLSLNKTMKKILFLVTCI